tara:strand:+ start:15503 stop:17386 length:1884 start_codon:yes stop_codon:yes gene_type:complete
MAEQLERLVVSLEARVNQFEKAMDKANRKTTQTTKQIEGRFSKMGTALAGQFGALAGRLVAPLAGAGAVMALRNAARGIAEVGDQARIAGLSVERFSELKYVAEQNRIGVDALTDGIKEMNLRADEFITTGGGSAAEAFARMGYSSDALAEKLKDPVSLFYEIIGQLGDLDKAAQIRVADEIFGGTGGERFVQLIEQGEQGLRNTAQAARDAGVVLNDDLVAKAGELDQAFHNVATTVGSTLQQAIVNAGWALYDFMQQFSAVENRTTVSLDNSLRELGARRVDLEHAILEQSSALRNLESEFGPDFQGIGGPGAALEQNIAGLREELSAVANEERAILDVLNSRTPVEPPRPQITVPGTGTGGGSGGGGGTSDIKAQRDAVAELIAQLEAERAALGLSNVEREIANALRQAGASATDAEKQQIIGLVTAISAETAAIEKTQAAMEELGQIGQDTLRDIIDGFIEGKSAAEIFSSALSDIGSRLLDIGLNSVFGGFGDLFGFANGGIAANGKPQPIKTFARGGVSNTAAIFGEAGPEAAVPLPDGRRIPVDLRMPRIPRSSAPQALTVHVSLDNDMLRATVKDEAGRTVAQAAPTIVGAAVGQANKSAPAAMARHQQQRAGSDFRTM